MHQEQLQNSASLSEVLTSEAGLNMPTQLPTIILAIDKIRENPMKFHFWTSLSWVWFSYLWIAAISSLKYHTPGTRFHLHIRCSILWARNYRQESISFEAPIKLILNYIAKMHQKPAHCHHSNFRENLIISHFPWCMLI